MKIQKFQEFILNEKLGINDSISELALIVFNNLDKNEIKLPLNKLGFTKVIIRKVNRPNILASFRQDKSNSEIIYLEVNKDVNIKLDTIEHELNHALQFRTDNKRLFKDLFKYNSLKMTDLLENHYEYDDLIIFKYYSQKTEIDSFTYNAYKELKELNTTKENFSKNLKKINSYKIIDFLEVYDPSNLRNINNEDLIKFLNIVEDNFNFQINNYKSRFYTLKVIFRIIKNALTNKFIAKSKENKIINIEVYINKLEKERKEALDYIRRKFGRLFDLF